MADFFYVVNAVTADAGGHFSVPGPIALAMNAGLVLGPLIDPQFGIVPAHVLCVTMAMAAARPHLAGIRRSQEALFRIHGGFVVLGSGIPSMAAGAGQPCLTMYITAEKLGRSRKILALQLGMAFGATVGNPCRPLRRQLRADRKEGKRPKQSMRNPIFSSLDHLLV
jgi:hypothetical protein